jgi:hypothetical protein
MAMMAALETLLIVRRQELEDDVWMAYVKMPCPNPWIHDDGGYCPDCENMFFELKDKNVPILGALMRLACANKRLYQIVRQ